MNGELKHPIQIWAEALLQKIESGKVCKSCGRPIVNDLPCSINKEHNDTYESSKKEKL